MKKSEIYKESNRTYYESHKEKIKEYNKQHYLKNKDRYKILHKQYYEKHKNKIHKVGNDRYRQCRYEFIQMYGGRCECCGEDTYEFLTIEHVQGQKGISKKEHSGKAYKDAVKNYNPMKYKILCSNCNHATRYGSLCPHKLRKLSKEIQDR